MNFNANERATASATAKTSANTDSDAIELSEYLSQHHEELHAYLSGLFGSARFADEITQDLLFYLWNAPVVIYEGNPMAMLLSMANRLGQYRKRHRFEGKRVAKKRSKFNTYSPSLAMCI